MTLIRPKPTLQNFTFRILLLWMAISFLHWVATGSLPTQYVDNENYTKTIPSFFVELPLETARLYLQLIELIFIASLFVLLFIPRSKILIILHVATGIAMMYFFLSLRQSSAISLAVYSLLLLPFIFRDSKLYPSISEATQTIAIALFILFAVLYFLKWYVFYKNPVIHNAFKAVAENLTARDNIAKIVFPWFYLLYALFLLRLYTTQFNKLLIYLAMIVLAGECILNAYFEFGLVLLFVPLLNWDEIFARFTARFQKS